MLCIKLPPPNIENAPPLQTVIAPPYTVSIKIRGICQIRLIVLIRKYLKLSTFFFAKILAAQGVSAKRHFGIVSLCALWITLLETATVHADNRITFRFKDGTDIEVGAE